ncbi:MAG TPA: chromate efflux transporter [Gemmataceae bacterium]|nr:chromate efflux transporter [Gemmataceae bacterium]
MTPAESSQEAPAQRGSLAEVALVFLRLGLTAFGGPAAHVALMEDEFVRRRRWLTRDKFLDLLGAAQLIPGPNSTELAIHLGYLRAGWPGLVAAGTCFILPAALLVAALAWAYRSFHSLPASAGMLYAVKPVVVAVVLQALLRFARTAVRTPFLAAVVVAAVVAAALRAHELAILAGAGLGTALGRGFARGRRPSAALLFAAAPAAGPTFAVPFGLWPLFLFFLKVGSVLFGSGYVLLAFLRADLVERYGWLTEEELLDAIAVGQVTPGPVSTTATFIGFYLGGPAGAVVATVGIFLPGFVLVALSGPIVPRLRRHRAAGDFLDGVNAASLALIAVVTWDLGKAALVDVPTWVLAVVSAALLLRWRVNAAWLVVGAALVGIAMVAMGLR